MLIATARHGTIDVSDDLSDLDVTLNENAPHLVSFSIINHRRKYDGIFTPNDRFVIRLKRIRWLQIMAGYLTQVPFFTVYPRSVELSGECSFKRLRYWLWDPGSTSSVNLLNGLTHTETLTSPEADDSFKRKTEAVLTEVAQWPSGSVHIGRLPSAWLDRIDVLINELGPEYAVSPDLLGSATTVNGQSGTYLGTTRLLRRGEIGDEMVPDVGPGWGVLPYTAGTVTTIRDSHFTGESLSAPSDPWPCEIRIPLTGLSTTAFQWWKGRKLLLINAKNNLTLCVRLAGAGPSDGSNRQIGITPLAMQRLGAKDGDSLSIRFADPTAEIGGTGAGLNTQTSSASGGGFFDSVNGIVGGVATAIYGTQPSEVGTTVAGSKGGLRPNAAAAFDFISQSFPQVRSIGGYAKSGHTANSDHYKGLALDVMVSSGVAGGEERQLGNAVAAWFVGNPNVFGVKYVIWFDRVNRGDGWKPYTPPADIGSSYNARHENHVHISFNDTGSGSMGAGGSPWPGSAAGDFPDGFGSITGPAGGAGGSGAPIGADWWFAQYNYESTILSGIRALMNDESILPFIIGLMNSSMRSCCSAPNGDFIGWFPDYFGVYGTAARMLVQNIELMDFSVVWSDEHLLTHVFTSGSPAGYGSPSMDADVEIRKSYTMGIASVEFPSIIKALLNVDESNPEAAGWLNPDAILKRFGARSYFKPMGALTSPQAEFWYALFLFQENWAKQFTARINLTFMPELWPGMLLVLPSYGIQFYVNQVHHRAHFGAGGGYTTEVSISAPSASDGSGLFGLPRGGRI